MKILIIGGVAAGTKVAAKLKRENRKDEVTILTMSKDISYAGCGLPYYIGDVIKEQDQLIVNTPESFSMLTGVNVLTETEVTEVNSDKKTVEAVNLNTNEISTYSYDKLIISTGAKPIKPPFEGINLDGIFTLRTPDDAVAIKNLLKAGNIKRAVIVGGGFIGLETAENLAKQNIKVSVIDMADHILPGFDPEIADYVENHLADRGIMAFPGTKLEAIIGDTKVEKIQTDKRKMKTDIVILSIGIKPNTDFLKDSGIKLMPNKTIQVDEYLQTNIKDVFAIGDCACVTNRITKSPAWSPMGSSANMEGRTLAQYINNKKIAYPGVLGTGITKLPELNVGKTGLSEEAAANQGYNPISVISVVDDKANYYPDSSFFIIKMVADRTTQKLLGIQVLGKGAVDKIVDIAVTALTLNATLKDLENMDLAYAPPFSTAIHPFTTAVNILLNKINGDFSTVTPAAYQKGECSDYKIIDASLSPTIQSAEYLDLTKVNGEVDGLNKDDKLLLVCAKGKRAYMLQNRLKFYGYKNTLVLEGGLTFNHIE
ncbi:pyridine nucleotide-disulfide oxidoreductase [Clostridium fermenticellae]|uniref:Pyridine nucleotide-disulfide oxidoreductase n=1 Tax=Clostridium fermenticellae TaxID=2068654 RepID=A0A386H1K7_9CLOT|nr:FAD-dependent oxidoreductase [Clostridium fermenticellae]AYD39544.1 pyridine nucleotide-disulfide oxidoreductase [Clostridium fermenticellae]